MPSVLERCSTGVADLDQVLQGGLPLGHTVLVAGGSGMGKTTLGFQYLCHGARSGEPGLFISITEPTQMLKQNLATYEFFEPEHLDQGLVTLLDLRAIAQRVGAGDGVFEPARHKLVLDILAKLVGELKARRLVIDSVTAICQWIQDPPQIRDFVFRLGLVLSELGCTTLLTSETPPRELRYSMFGVEEFIADGIIFLSEAERHGDLIRTAQVVKMRGTHHSRSKFFMELSSRGIELTQILKDTRPGGL